MKPPHQLRIRTVVTYVPAIASLCVAGMTLLVLIGWMLDIELFKSLLHPGRIAMNPVTAVALLMLAVGLFLIRGESPAQSIAVVVKILAGIVVAIAVLKLANILIGWRLDVDRILFRAKLGVNAMSPNTAIAFLLLAAGMLFF